MTISRRRFIKYCGLAAGAMGLDSVGLGLLEKVLANPLAPSVIWLQGTACAGCSVSLLNRISDSQPLTVAEVLTDAINLVYHTTLMTPAGDPAVAELRRVYEGGSYVLVIEGGVPTAANGATCIVHSFHGEEVPFEQAVQEMSARAIATVCVGTCASFGGIPASGSNPTGIMGVSQITGRPTINISGCPANPDWVVWAIVQLLTGTPVDLDSDGRPTALYNTNLSGQPVHELVHDRCPRNQYVNPDAPAPATSFSDCDGRCLINLGCRGPLTKSRCDGCWNEKATDPTSPPSERWRNWCVGANAPCQGCVERTFPGPESFFELYQG
jgi:hydrogenase small subunit